MDAYHGKFQTMMTNVGDTDGVWVEEVLWCAAAGATASGARCLPRVTSCSLSSTPCPGLAYEHSATLALVRYVVALMNLKRILERLEYYFGTTARHDNKALGLHGDRPSLTACHVLFFVAFMMLPNVSFSALPASLGGPLVIDDSLTACLCTTGSLSLARPVISGFMVAQW